MNKRIIVGISGATGIQYGIRALELLKEQHYETHLIVSKPAEMVRSYETTITHEQLVSLAHEIHLAQDIGSVLASGSFKTAGMLIAPCSIKTMSEIATGVTSTLMSRAADVVLKERRRLVLLLRETPLHLGHLRSMTAITEMGGVLMPPVPALYLKPESVDEMITHSVARALDLFGIDIDVKRWDHAYRNSLKK
ncbi:UbiX family flavin prenyltransferase [Niabella soli]|uniref:Flavin prenyltransferase UbiX n=1 Tax=Niabella soli DSM 19437 TaxID=929713 RepID=W0EU74_9BACT|nr:UbiX family flavin prenyltransferase [Niabella soli]AHF14322.1 aromatic acid decarboxylase [Niabella soli DSM 19437]